MNRRQIGRILSLAALVALIPTLAQSTVRHPVDEVAVDIVGGDGRVFPRYRVQAKGNVERFYLEAIKGENYAIRIRNRTGRRIGVVVAVDGRNIISGERSHLAPTERMYILGPYRSGTYEGWRTSLSQVHRFYFTESGDSYAMAWGDDSAMGVIAVAVYRERRREEQELKAAPGDRAAGESSRAPAAAEPGTGFGNATRSRAVRVHFDPERTPVAKYFFKYEWRQSLCDRGIIPCEPPGNRFWPDELSPGGFVPYPPGHRR